MKCEIKEVIQIDEKRKKETIVLLRFGIGIMSIFQTKETKRIKKLRLSR